MKSSTLKVLAILATILILFSTVPFASAQSQTQEYTVTFQLLNRPNGDVSYELNLTFSQDLHQYYKTKSHIMFSEADFSKFVTPYTLKPIADRLWQIYDKPEDFTNGVLMLVHQITYEETYPVKYPIETMAEGKGDCDLFAFIAASILQAGGIDTVLLFYKTQEHMQIGVNLADPPKDARTGIYSVNYQDAPYYIAECTGGNWRNGWRVGESPTAYQNASVQVIPLDRMEQSSIGQVTANLKELDPSTINLQLSTALLLEYSPVRISGQILPQAANQNVTLEAKINSDDWIIIGIVQTQSDGRFEMDWFPQTSGSATVQASWVGNNQYNGAKSDLENLFVMPLYAVFATLAGVLTALLASAAFLVVKKQKPKATIPSAPQTNIENKPQSESSSDNPNPNSTPESQF